jgi:hypothetical protein
LHQERAPARAPECIGAQALESRLACA